MKTITFTDDEAEAVRRAVASLAGKDDDGRHLRSALVKLDRGSDERHVEIVLDSTAAKSAAPLFSGRVTRWRPQFEAMVRLGSKRGKVTVYVDGVEVDASKLKPNQPLTCLGDS